MVQYGYVDILSQTTTPVNVTWDTTPTGAILRALLYDSTTDISTIDSTALQALVDDPAIEKRLINIEANAEYYVDNGFFSSTPSLILHAPATISGTLYAIDGTTPLKESYIVKICDRLSGAVMSLDDDTGYYSINNIVPGDHTISVYGDDGSIIGSKTITIPDGAVLNDIDIITTIIISSFPEINIKQGSTDIPSGTGVYDFESVNIGNSSSVITFTIENKGTTNLTLDDTPNIQINGVDASDFSVDQSALLNTILPNNNSTFTITFIPLITGNKTVTISIANNDTDENPYTFTLNGKGTSPLKFSAIAAGMGHQLLLDETGTVWAVGSDKTVPQIDDPGFFELTSDAKDVFAGGNGRYVLKNDNTLWGMGSVTSTLTKITDNVKYANTVGNRMAIIKTDGTLWVSDDGTYFAHTHPTEENHSIFCKAMENVKDVAVGYLFYLILKDDNSLWVTGLNRYGTLGLGTSGDQNNRSDPIELTDDVKSISAGKHHTLVLKNDDTLWATGNNHYGQLGLGDNGQRNKLTKLTDDVKDMKAGESNSFVLKNNGTLWATGYNYYGQLGVGDTVNRSALEQIMIDDIKSISAGFSNFLMLKNDDTVWIAGYAADINGTIPIQVILSK